MSCDVYASAGESGGSSISLPRSILVCGDALCVNMRSDRAPAEKSEGSFVFRSVLTVMKEPLAFLVLTSGESNLL